MISRYFVGTKLGPIVFIDESINLELYILVLNNNLLSYLDAFIADSAIDIIFQQDNARPHIFHRIE